ncbi:MAG: hypothetical protein IPP58_00055 [Holophagaceae bacterium]|uniref:Rhodanese domain-containing protein n=1 Tax=Candidatus Geothrix skivensis TaxID=2954439 RepID=A0A9D7SER2_9BACT|nr:hypothetical protein [Candidatus Geothrix skivensis]
MGPFDGKGMVIQGLRFLAPKEALDTLQAGALLVDLRSDELVEMKAFRVPETIHIPHGELSGLPRNYRPTAPSSWLTRPACSPRTRHTPFWITASARSPA